MLLPLNQISDWMAIASRLLFPTTRAIEVMREILLEDRSLGILQVDWGLGLLFAQPVVFLVVGSLFFKASERLAKQKGTLARY